MSQIKNNPISTQSNAFLFYYDRLKHAPDYGLAQGNEIIKTVLRCAFNDSELSQFEFLDILDYAETFHKKLMEVNYNEGWNN